MIRKVRIPIAALGAILMSLCGQTARADLVSISGNLTSDGSAVGSGDPVIIDPSTINPGDPFSITLSYDPASFTQSGSSYVLTNASLMLQFDGYTFGYTSAAGNYIEFSTPGAFGRGTTSFLICSSLANCSTQDFLTLYFQGIVTSPSTLGGASGRIDWRSRRQPCGVRVPAQFLRRQPNRSAGDSRHSGDHHTRHRAWVAGAVGLCRCRAWRVVSSSPQ
jgi:hypothetical protein